MVKSNELSRYVPYLVDSQKEKNQKFVLGLNHGMAYHLYGFLDKSFSDLVSLATMHEKSKKAL